ncbi:MAG: DUF1002 domain-containing protein [Blautia sp.]
MKKRSLIVAALCSMCLALGNPLPVMADASKVVTLGADLTDEQKNTMMKYFKADASQVQIITVNNQDERNYLGKYISSAQIGTRTLSCAYVKTNPVRRHQGSYCKPQLRNLQHACKCTFHSRCFQLRGSCSLPV